MGRKRHAHRCRDTLLAPAGGVAEVEPKARSYERKERPHEQLDGAICVDTGEIRCLPLVQDQERIQSWRRALASTHADSVIGPEAVSLDPPERVVVGPELRRLLDFLAWGR